MYKLNTPVEIDVYLNVYDLNPANASLYACGLGFYHTGIQLDLKEFTFGGHQGNETGVMEVPPKTNHPNFRESILLGKTSYSYREIYNMLDSIKEKFPGNSYHLIRKNCNTFTNCFSEALLHKPIPSWVDRMAKIGRFFTEASDFLAMRPYESRWETAAGELGVKL